MTNNLCEPCFSKSCKTHLQLFQLMVSNMNSQLGPWQKSGIARKPSPISTTIASQTQSKWTEIFQTIWDGRRIWLRPWKNGIRFMPNTVAAKDHKQQNPVHSSLVNRLQQHFDVQRPIEHLLQHAASHLLQPIVVLSAAEKRSRLLWEFHYRCGSRRSQDILKWVQEQYRQFQ